MTPDTTTTHFDSQGTRCAAWLTLPPRPGPHPVVVLAHGFGANHTMSLGQYEQHFSQAGIATLAFDYRHTGDSGGLPRQRLSLRNHRQDIHAAIDFARGRPELDATRIALWGSSLGAMHALKVAAGRPDLAAVVVQCPIVDGPATLRRLGLGAALRLGPAMLADAARRLVGATPHYVPIVGPAGSTAAVTAAGALQGWRGVVSPGGSFDNRVGASDVLGIAFTSALRSSRQIAAPLLVCVSERDNLMDPRHAVTVAQRAPRGQARHYDSDHFEVYHPPLLTRILADQTEFLQRSFDAAIA
ncbi:alpha/beta hydrolase [Mycolicibacter arupensis]|uniref:Alpha/beta hydrolase n=1 Tax=Mycolicibacter arupensis TaxID=342002 RepID=A0A0F5MWT6_9MYCO|nr:alpha/beta hydrolase [Mycolicibacter arupensis]KKB99079.1 alpha/beta hydrolase [Mycolicibacter arupensis]MCV7274954.1 alpha/beta fold hydrolase [Mycolicibacter arupensis]OQZ97424.1 alpha/beta hydrolase [Mycolicibacter arupensis]TXI52832.1 MAG: alpha/beta hydrolase [Mycolicibacter arupensis]